MTSHPGRGERMSDCTETGAEASAAATRPAPDARPAESPSGETVAARGAADVLRAAKALIDMEEKWIKGIMRDGDARCAVGAILLAAPTMGGYVATAKMFALAAGAEPGRIAFWNDAPERTHAEVMAAFDRAIQLAEKQS